MPTIWTTLSDGTFHVQCTHATPGTNPYVGPGLAGTPDRLERVCATTDQLSSAVREAEFLRETTATQVSANSGVALDTVRRIEQDGKAPLHDVRSVLLALGITPVCLPPLSELTDANAGMQGGAI